MAWTVFLYVFTAIVGGLFIFYAFFKPKKPKGAGNSPLHRYKAALKTLPLGTKNGWELIGIEHGLRLWERNGSAEGSVFASSMILPISLKVLVKMLIDPSQMLEWDPWVKTVSRISVSNEKSTESSQDSGDVVSLTVAPNSSSKFLEAVDILTSLFKNDPKICSRTWHHEVNTEFWLHSASVEPHSSDPLYSLMMAFPLKKTNEECEVIIFSEGMVGFNPCSLTSKLAGLQEYIVHHHSEAVYPEIKGQEEDSVIDDEEKVFEEAADGDIVGKSTLPPSEVFVDVSGVYLRPEKDVQAKYKVAIDHAIQLLMIHYNAKAGENGWYLVGKVKNVEILKKPASPGFSIWDCSKGTIEVNVPVHYLLAYCNDLNHNSDYDDMFHAGHTIESVGELTNVVYSEYKAIWPVSGRDFSAFVATRALPDSIYVSVARSADTNNLLYI